MISDRQQVARVGEATPELPHYPDGLTPAWINMLIAQAFREHDASSASWTLAVADGSVAERKALRVERRAADGERLSALSSATRLGGRTPPLPPQDGGQPLVSLSNSQGIDVSECHFDVGAIVPCESPTCHEYCPTCHNGECGFEVGA